MITVQKAVTATTSDLLAATDLANIPSDGQIDFFVGSTQNDSTFTLTGPGNEPIAQAQKIEQRTNGMPVMSDSIPFSVGVSLGGHYIISVTVVTAATIVMWAVYRSAEELGL